MTSLFRLGSSFLGRLGRLQLFLTGPGWLHGIAGWVYLLWFGGLVGAAILAAPFLEARFGPAAGAGVQLGGAALVYVLALGLVILCFQRDGEEDSSRRGLFTGRGEFVYVVYEGEQADPKLRLLSPFKKRLGWMTLAAGGLGMTVAFALFCQGLHHAGLTHWFTGHEGPPSDCRRKSLPTAQNITGLTLDSLNEGNDAPTWPPSNELPLLSVQKPQTS